MKNQQTNKPAAYSVWIGGIEANDYPMTQAQAAQLADHYKKQGYDDIAIEELTTPTK
jgi:hypothetical protein